MSIVIQQYLPKARIIFVYSSIANSAFPKMYSVIYKCTRILKVQGSRKRRRTLGPNNLGLNIVKWCSFFKDLSRS